MASLDRKLARDLWHMRGQALAVALVVASGIGSFVTARSAYDSLWKTHIEYYRDYRFPEVFASLKRAPRSLARRIQAIPGVDVLEMRVVMAVTLDVPGLAEPASARLISIPDRRPPALNQLHLRRGRYVDPGHPDEALVSAPFAEANDLQLGDRLGALINGRWERLRIVGMALSPEYIFEIPTGGVLPDKRRFGTLWMGEDAVARAFDMDGAFNDVCLTLVPGASEGAVIAALDGLLERYGGLGAYGRADHRSHSRFTQEFDELRAWGTLMPAIFLGVAAFLLQTSTTRLVFMQRDQIAVLKAFGYSNRAVGIHYLKLVLAVVAVGATLGLALGYRVGLLLMHQYDKYFHFPTQRYELPPVVVVWALVVSLTAAVVGALSAVRRAVSMPPAEAMRPEAPARFRIGFLERWGLMRLASPAGRIILRNLVRRPARLALSIGSMALAVMVIVVGRSFFDIMDELVNLQFRAIERQHATIFFNEPLTYRGVHDLSRLPGVLRVEPFRVVPVNLRFGSRVEKTALFGLTRRPELRRIVGRNLVPFEPPPAGIVLTDFLAEQLGVQTGETVRVEVLEGRRRVEDVPLVGQVDELLGTNAYMEQTALARLLGESPTLSGAYLALDSAEAERLNSRLKATPAVAGVSMREAALRSFDETIADVFGVFTSILVGLACVIAAGMVYNGARIALSERGRELASLRVLGFTRAEVTQMLLGEQALITLAAVPVGFALGYGLSGLITRAYQNELIRLPLLIAPFTFTFAFVVIAAAAVLSGLLVKARIDRLDLVAVLKTRE